MNIAFNAERELDLDELQMSAPATPISVHLGRFAYAGSLFVGIALVIAGAVYGSALIVSAGVWIYDAVHSFLGA